MHIRAGSAGALVPVQLANTSSIAAQDNFPTFVGLLGDEGLRHAHVANATLGLGPKDIRVWAREPGIVGTELQGHVTDADALERLEGTRQQIDWLVPEDVAEAIDFHDDAPGAACEVCS